MKNGAPAAAPALLSGSSIYLASNVFTAAVWFALLPVLTHFLDPREYGEAAMFTTLVGALSAFVGLNVVAASGRRHYDGGPPKELAEFMGACLQILAVSGLVALGAVLLFREQLSAVLGLAPRWLPWAVLVAVLSCLLQLRQSQWQVRGQSRPYAMLQSGEAATQALLSLVLVAALLQGGAGRIAAGIASASVFALLAVTLLRRDGLLKVRTWRPDHLKEALVFGVPLVPHVAASFVLAAADRVVVSAELGLAQAGIYMLAAHLAQAALLFFDAINQAYVPWLFERLKAGDAASRRRIVRYTYAWFAVLLAAAGIAFHVGPWLVRLVGGERYAAAGSAIPWLLLGQVFGGMYLMVTNYVFYGKRTGLLSAVTVASAAIHIALLLVLAPRLGIEGAAMAFCIAMGMRFLLTWWAAQRSHPMPWFALREGSPPAG